MIKVPIDDETPVPRVHQTAPPSPPPSYHADADVEKNVASPKHVA
jgi:hypothetical protein